MPNPYKYRHETRPDKRKREALNKDLQRENSDLVDEMLEALRYRNTLKDAYKQDPEKALAWFDENKELMDRLGITKEQIEGDD